MKGLNKHVLKEYGAHRSHFSHNVTAHRKVFMAHKGNLLPGERSLSLHGANGVLNKGTAASRDHREQTQHLHMRVRKQVVWRMAES